MALDPATVQAGFSIGSKVLGGIFGGKSKKKAAKKAAKAQEAAALRQEAAAKAFDERTQKQTEPYRQFGAGATSKLSDLLGIDSANPEYARNEADFNNLQAEYTKLLQTPAPRQNTPFSKNGIAGLSTKMNNGQLEQPTNSINPLIADARSRLDASRARLDGTQRNSERSGGFGSLLKSFSEQDLNNDVVYNKGLQFGLDEGTKGLERRSLATGGFDSGAALKELTRYANDYGETKASGAQQRFMGDKGFTFNSLLGGTQVGQNAVNTASGNSTTALNSMNNAIANRGNVGAGRAFAIGDANNEMFSNIGKQFEGFDFGGLFGKKKGTPPYIPSITYGGSPVKTTVI